MGSDEAASVAVAVLFGLALIACVISKKTAGFRLYLLLGLSCALRCIGFATRAAQLDQPTNTDLAAVSLVFRQAGYGISIAVLCILSGCYFKNARNEMRPPRSFPLWSVGVRLLIAPVSGLGQAAAPACVAGGGGPLCSAALLRMLGPSPNLLQMCTGGGEPSSPALPQTKVVM